MKSIVTRVIAHVLVLAIASSSIACGHDASGGISQAAAPFSELNVDSMIAAFAVSGIAVYDTQGSTQPIVPVIGKASPLTLIRWQVRTMAFEAANGGGYSGDDLDKISPLPKKLPPISMWIAIWAEKYTSIAARSARALIRRPDWRHPKTIVFPMAVLALFVADLTIGTARHVKSRGAFQSGTQVADAGPFKVADVTCQPIDQTINQAITAIFEGLKGLSSNGAFLFIVNVLQSVAEVVVGTTINNLFKFLQPAITVIAITVQVIPLLKAWTVTVTVAPAVTDATSGPFTMNFTATANTHQLEVPQAVDCALKLIGVDLAELEKVVSPVQWSTQDPNNLGHIDGHDNKLDTKNQAVMTFIVNRRAETGAPIPKQFRGIAVVFPGQFAALAQQLRAALHPALPKGIPDFFGIQSAIDTFLSKQANVAAAQLQRLFKAQANQLATVILHKQNPGPPGGPQPKPPPPPQPNPPPHAAVPPCNALITPNELSSASGRRGFEILPTGPVCHYEALSLDPQLAAAGLKELLGHIAVWDTRMNISPQAVVNIADGMGVPAASTIDGLWARTPSSPCFRAGVTCFTSADHRVGSAPLPYPGGVLYMHVPGAIVEIYYTNHDTHRPDIGVETEIARFVARRL